MTLAHLVLIWTVGAIVGGLLMHRWMGEILRDSAPGEAEDVRYRTGIVLSCVVFTAAWFVWLPLVLGAHAIGMWRRRP